MKRRAKGPERKAQIVEAALRLLGNTPLASLTTRQIARELSISQPALFRHFASREQLLLSVLDHARAQLGEIANIVLERTFNPLDRIRALATELLSYVDKHPGLPRLLFSAPEEENLRNGVRHLVSMQVSFVALLIQEAQEQGLLRASLDRQQGAFYFVGLIQGLVLRGQMRADDASLSDEVEALMSFWLDGARSRETSETSLLVAKPSAATSSEMLRSLDVRPILESGTDPLEAILKILAEVQTSGVLVVIAPFVPKPLITLLRQRGHLVVAREVLPKTWCIEIVVGGSPEIRDLLDLEPPEPLEIILETASKLEPGDVVLARLPKYPKPLLPLLRERCPNFEIALMVDGTALLRLEASS